ncbi:MAG: SPOR domain-containing protein [candidate division Zixibacteria bacterium]|nr:SPOR domain-containing protein [candidate division Zixibacteria bacterium]
MRTFVNICNIALVLILAVAPLGCLRPGPVGDEKASEAPSSSEPERRFDPLDLPADLEIIPEVSPLNSDLTRAGIIVTRDQVDTASSNVDYSEVPLGIDSANSQAFRIQLLTSKVYGEARRAVKVAEEIFDRPIYLDYEVPYFKVRVGSFHDRFQAEEYLMRARAAGYKEAWVVVTNIAVREAAPLYLDEPYPASYDSIDEDSYYDPIFESDDEPVTDD